MAAEVFQSIAVKEIYGSGTALRIGNEITSHGLISQNDLLVSGKLEVNNIAYFDSTVQVNYSLQNINNVFSSFGSSSNVRMGYATTQTPNNFMLGVSTESNSMVICERADVDIDFAHALQTNPTLFIHSADATDTTQWISFTHDQTDATINWGAGNLNLEGATHTGTGDVAINGYVTISVAGVAKKFATVA